MPWATDSERKLRQLKDEVFRLEAERSKAVDLVRNIALRVTKSLNDHGDDLAASLITWADELRDALAPFDSGVREAVAEAPLPDPAQIAKAYGQPWPPHEVADAQRKTTWQEEH